MNGFSAADMSTAAASGHAEGYQAGYADAVKAYELGAAQEAVVWGIRIGASDSWGYTNNEEQADFLGKQSGLPYEKKPLYVAPVAAAPGIDLAERVLCVLIEEGVLARNGRVFQKLRTLIDASPKGGSDLVTVRMLMLANRWDEIAKDSPSLGGLIHEMAREMRAAMQATSAEVGS